MPRPLGVEHAGQVAHGGVAYAVVLVDRLLHDLGDLDRLVECATDQPRHDRMLDLSGGDTAAFAEITEAQTAVELTTTVRNKALESFNEIMRMPL